MSTQRRAFTLVELLVVIAIISVLAGLLLPVLEETLSVARITQCMNNERQFVMSLQFFMPDHADIVPPCGYRYASRMPWLTQLHQKEYLPDLGVLICPAAPDLYGLGIGTRGNPHDRQDPKWVQYFWDYTHFDDRWYQDPNRGVNEPGIIYDPSGSTGTYIYAGGAVGSPHLPSEQPSWVFSTAHGYNLKLWHVRQPSRYAVLWDMSPPIKDSARAQVANHRAVGAVQFAFLDGHVKSHRDMFVGDTAVVHPNEITPYLSPNHINWGGDANDLKAIINP